MCGAGEGRLGIRTRVRIHKSLSLNTQTLTTSDSLNALWEASRRPALRTPQRRAGQWRQGSSRTSTPLVAGH